VASLLLGQLGKFCGVSGTSHAMAQRAVNFNLIPEKSTNRCITNRWLPTWVWQKSVLSHDASLLDLNRESDDEVDILGIVR
jgi:hypothetical protein